MSYPSYLSYRLRILHALREPGSPRKAGFLEEVEQRRAGNCIERIVRAVAKLVAKYHDDETPGGRATRFIIGAYPARKGGG